MRNKLTIEYIKQKTKEITNEYICLSNKYINNTIKLKFICDLGHNFKMRWNDFNAGHRCPICYNDYRGASQRLTLEYVKNRTKELESEYECISNEYKNSQTKLEFKCNKGHIYKSVWGHFQQGRRCPICARNVKLTIEFVKETIPKINKGYICTSNEYVDCMSKLDFICDKGHSFKMSWDSISHNHKCPTCSKSINSSYYKCGSEHPLWNGGTSWEPYCRIWTDKQFKDFIKERDNFECQNDDCWKTSKNLCIHHINYNKKDCDLYNLITICISCNTRANINRKYWEEYYKEVIKNNDKRSISNVDI